MRFISDDGDIYLGKIIGLVLAFFVVVGIIMAALWGFGVLTASVKGQGEAYKEIQSKDFRLEAYNYFFDQLGSIKGLEGSIDSQLAALKLYEKGSKDYNRVVTNISALQSLRHQAIQKYNYDAQKNWTMGQFKDNDLPYQIPDTEYPEGGIQ